MKAGAVERVLIAVDDSVESLQAARTGAQIAAGLGSMVRVINVVADATDVAPAGSHAGRTEETKRLLEHVVQAVRLAGVPEKQIDAVTRHGEPFRGILDEAREWRAGLIVVSVSGSTGLRSAYVGSATEHVLEFAECPVLVVPRMSKRDRSV